MAKQRNVADDSASWRATIGTISHMDCVDGMAAMPAESAALVFGDPPFNIGRDYDSHNDRQKPADYLKWSARWLDQAVRILKPDGSLWICVSEEYQAELKVLAEGRFALAFPDGKGTELIRRATPVQPLRPRHHVVWYYTFGVNAPKKLSRSHTHLLHFVKSLDGHKWNPDQVRVPSARAAIYNDKRASPDGRLPDDTWIIRPQDDAAGFGGDNDVMHESRVCGTYKERQPVDNQMPEQLIARVVRLCTDEGDLVVSPFSGSGTDAVVSKKLNRKFAAFDTSEAYVLQSLLRLESARPGDMLDAPEKIKAGTKKKR